MRKGVAVEVGDVILILIVLTLVIFIVYDLVMKEKLGNTACHAVADRLKWEGPIINAIRSLVKWSTGYEMTPLHDICNAVVKW